MAKLIVVGFKKDMYRASEVLNRLQSMNDDWVVDLHGAMIEPGDSAICALLRTANPDIVADQFRGYGGTILSTTLTRDQQARVEKSLSSNAAAA